MKTSTHLLSYSLHHVILFIFEYSQEAQNYKEHVVDKINADCQVLS